MVAIVHTRSTRPRHLQGTGGHSVRISLNELKKRFPDHPGPAPLELAGEWVAWNKDRSKIVAHGRRFGEVRTAAIATGCREPLMQRVLGTPFVGGA